MKWTWMLVVLLRGANHGFWSHLECLGQNSNIFHYIKFCIFYGRKETLSYCFGGLIKLIREEIYYHLSVVFKVVSFRGQIKLGPRLDWSPLGA